MSHYETREQRQIRQLQQNLRAATQQNEQSRRAQAELERALRRSEKERQRAERELQTRIERQQREIERQQRSLQDQHRRNGRLNQAVEAINATIVAQEQRQTARLQQLQEQRARDQERQNARITQVSQQLQGQITQTRRELEGQLSALRTETDQQLSAIRAQRDRDIAWTREQLNETNTRINEIESSVEAMQRTLEQHREIAEYWLSQAERLRAEIRESLRPEHFESQRWAQLQQTIENANSDIRNGMYQVAASNGREAYQEAYELRNDLIAQEMEWQQTLEAVRQLESALLENAAAAEARTYEFELDGEQITERRGVDYWTYGQLSVLNGRISELRSRLNADTDSLSTDDLRRFQQELAGLLTELGLLENAAAANLAMAQGRYNMVERIGEVLGDQFLMDEADGDYFAQENRDEYHAVFRNPNTGTEAVVTITPLIGEDGVVVNHAELIINEPDNDPNARAAINDAVVRQVAQEVEDFALPCSGQYGENTNQEAQRTGDISAVSEGNEQVRSQCGRNGVTYQGQRLTNPAVQTQTAAPSPSAAQEQE